MFAGNGASIRRFTRPKLDSLDARFRAQDACTALFFVATQRVGAVLAYRVRGFQMTNL
jgi:hypothetical protein